MMRDHQHGLIGLDLGTSMLKGVVIDLSGQVVASSQINVDYQVEGPVCEFDVEQFYDRLACLTRKLVTTLPAPMNLIGLSIASASGNTVLVGRDGRALRPAISWLDQRLDQHQDQFPDNDAECILNRFEPSETYQIVGWPYLRSFPLAHLAWLRAHQADALQEARKICLSTDYINYRLTGEWGIDPSTATTFYLQDQVRQQWHQPFLDRLDIDSGKLPEIRETGTILGRLTNQASAETGLPEGLPVIMGAFDHPCAARGSGVLEAGQVMLSAGTSWVLFLPEQDREHLLQQHLLCDPFLRENGLWGAMASLPAISQKIDSLICRWLTNGADRIAVFTQMASQAPAGADGLVVNMQKIDESDDFSRYSRPSIARALMEGTAFLLEERMKKLKEAGMDVSHLTMVGGAAENAVWSQIVCNVIGQPISVIKGSMSGAVGAAILAGCGVKAFEDEWAAAKQLQIQRTWLRPNQKNYEQYVRIIKNNF